MPIILGAAVNSNLTAPQLQLPRIILASMLTAQTAPPRARTCQQPLSRRGAAGWLWLDMALAAKAQGEDAFTAGKVAACWFFFEQEMPRVALWLDLAAGSDIAVALDVEGF
ncbi:MULTISPECIES: acyl-CoA dehydrogenase C-terminal domain-containing protein [unclassified Phenylobacterium]|uniref:acyl-CoA dehydrogenase C-terminal domain-containing protein n=1 Tax=unclassified Phenylobacterium TaxID=2640670 RepID=UPI0022B531B3|nr:acyl-CoA dehydrogenase C-terminal domain-containing protein [Phenylobacterium sp. NIBR 498073]WGU39526.1 acyl-CoA dehydrogenase C-terminal domain-containing protein [Phenylobacterium sp. NIBR 498073]